MKPRQDAVTLQDAAGNRVTASDLPMLMQAIEQLRKLREDIAMRDAIGTDDGP
jgi:hypothetical protein